MAPYLREFIGTAILILLGDSCVTDVILKGTKGNGSGRIVISTGLLKAKRPFNVTPGAG